MKAITRKEKIMSGENLTPITRKEMFLAKAAGQDIQVPTPITREEWFLSRIGQGGGSAPTYNGYIPLGKYVFHPNPDGANLYIADGYDENDEYWAYPDWFTTTDTDGELRTCFGVGCLSDSEEAECYYNPDFADFLISNGTTITVIAEIEVTKEQFNAFMQYFTPQ